MKNIVKITAVAAIAFTATGVFAAPHHEHHKETNGIRLAADIINLVHSTVNLLTGTPDTVIINQANTVVTQPTTIVETACHPKTTLIINNPPPPPPKPVIINNTHPRPNPLVIINNRKPKAPNHGKVVVKNVKHNFAAQPKPHRR